MADIDTWRDYDGTSIAEKIRQQQKIPQRDFGHPQAGPSYGAMRMARVVEETEMRMAYIVLKGATPEILQERVRTAMFEQNMQPSGGVLFDGKLYMQAMVRA